MSSREDMAAIEVDQLWQELNIDEVNLDLDRRLAGQAIAFVLSPAFDSGKAAGAAPGEADLLNGAEIASRAMERVAGDSRRAGELLGSTLMNLPGEQAEWKARPVFSAEGKPHAAAQGALFGAAGTNPMMAESFCELAVGSGIIEAMPASQAADCAIEALCGARANAQAGIRIVKALAGVLLDSSYLKILNYYTTVPHSAQTIDAYVMKAQAVLTVLEQLEKSKLLPAGTQELMRRERANLQEDYPDVAMCYWGESSINITTEADYEAIMAEGGTVARLKNCHAGLALAYELRANSQYLSLEGAARSRDREAAAEARQTAILDTVATAREGLEQVLPDYLSSAIGHELWRRAGHIENIDDVAFCELAELAAHLGMAHILATAKDSIMERQRTLELRTLGLEAAELLPRFASVEFTLPDAYITYEDSHRLIADLEAYYLHDDRNTAGQNRWGKLDTQTAMQDLRCKLQWWASVSRDAGQSLELDMYRDYRIRQDSTSVLANRHFSIAKVASGYRLRIYDTSLSAETSQEDIGALTVAFAEHRGREIAYDGTPRMKVTIRPTEEELRVHAMSWDVLDTSKGGDSELPYRGIALGISAQAILSLYRKILGMPEAEYDGILRDEAGNRLNAGTYNPKWRVFMAGSQEERCALRFTGSYVAIQPQADALFVCADTVSTSESGSVELLLPQVLVEARSGAIDQEARSEMVRRVRTFAQQMQRNTAAPYGWTHFDGRMVRTPSANTR